MLRIAQVQEIEELLLQLPDLVEQQERRATGFPHNADLWLKSLERAFVANRQYQGGSIAALRGGLVAAQLGQKPVELEFRSHAGRARVLSAVASQAIQRAADVAAAVLAGDRARLGEAERVAQHIVAAAASRGLVVPREASVSSAEYLGALRHSLAASEDLETAAVHLEGLVGPVDALVLIDRALTPFLRAKPR